jgi:hypothetical protein
MNVAVGLILSGGFPVPTAFLKGVFDWYGATVSGSANSGRPDEGCITQARLIYSEDFPIDAARNDICRVMLDKSDAAYLIFLDCDMRHPSTVLHDLVRHGLPIVSGRYQMRKAPFKTVAMRKVGAGPRDYDSITEQSGVVPIDAGGAGVLAIRRDVLETIRDKDGDEWFRYQVGPSGLRHVSEDMHFFERAKACGFPAVCDLDIVCSHVTSFEIDPGWHTPFRTAHDAAKVSVAVPV